MSNVASVILIKKYIKNEFCAIEDLVIKEHRVNLFVNAEHYISFMCLPQHLNELAVGFLFSEKIIRSYADIASIDSSRTGDIFVVTKNNFVDKPNRGRVVTSGFSDSKINAIVFEREKLRVNTSPHKISADKVIKMADYFNTRSTLFQRTGAVHSCALIAADNAHLFYEDIGRHNALDKLTGKVLMTHFPVESAALFTSGRISCEMLIKTARLGVSILISTAAPTDMAVRMAKEACMTLIGFARADRFNVYCGFNRII